VQQPSRLLNWMQLLEDAQCSIERVKDMKQISFYHILSLASYQKKVVFRQDSNMSRIKCIQFACLHARESMLCMLQRYACYINQKQDKVR